MLVIIVQAAIPVRETDDKISALMLWLAYFCGTFKFHFGSVFKIVSLE